MTRSSIYSLRISQIHPFKELQSQMPKVRQYLYCSFAPSLNPSPATQQKGKHDVLVQPCKMYNKLF